MNAFTRLSGKGQVVVPKATRDRLGWAAGLDLEVIETGDAVTLRPRRTTGQLGVDDAMARFRLLYRHEGSALAVDRLGWSADVDDQS
ncbi:AbrB/MazE/SpoVT family DNA-binding domain-containing protein [Sphingomonas adhaesiva]|uniref:AbrB/MazE/SpoVT family DNA-binding domain-containing protein n=1 Tax=Sphingomonas adhaesiva TaxID=28212 RepID=UPI002FF82E42